ncbi:hypothetical protein [Haematobacter sp. UBA3484]|uniref:hypothetical protein n=1 Tax=Haematobacter sp. UBA3484 TaxID=1946582 RepID=UPI0025C3DE4B|nr:hypothetical protein [Haematobacter sp. UBA3484]
MAQASDRAALTLLISSAMAYCEREIDAMNRSVRLLEKADRQRLMNAYAEGEYWRGLASDEFRQMVNALQLLKTA